uniref:hypothetical protein n=1 Tax=Flavobacterium sp. TaxID=239 RepID=UPI004047C432
MARLTTGPQGITLRNLFLRVVAEQIPVGLYREYLGNEPDESIYPEGLGYVRWTVDSPQQSLGGYEVVQNSFNDLTLTEQALQSQPWWQNETLARQVAEEISGGVNGTPQYGNPNNGFFGPWLAYDLVQDAGVATVAYQGSSGVLTGSGTFQSPLASLFYLIQPNLNPSPASSLSGPWLPIYQAQLAIPIDYDGDAPLGFDVIEAPGVILSGELVSL